MNSKIDFNHIKNLFFIFIFVLIQFNNFNSYAIEKYAYNKNIFDYKDYIKVKYLTENVVNSYHKIESNLKSEVSKRKVFIDDFTNSIFINHPLKISFQNKINYIPKQFADYNLLSTLNPRAPPFF